MAVPVVVPSTQIERAWTLLAIAALIFAVAVLLFVVWQVFASVKATGFDSDGVRCYKGASAMSCIKTAEPPR